MAINLSLSGKVSHHIDTVYKHVIMQVTLKAIDLDLEIKKTSFRSDEKVHRKHEDITGLRQMNDA